MGGHAPSADALSLLEELKSARGGTFLVRRMDAFDIQSPPPQPLALALPPPPALPSPLTILRQTERGCEFTDKLTSLTLNVETKRKLARRMKIQKPALVARIRRAQEYIQDEEAAALAVVSQHVHKRVQARPTGVPVFAVDDLPRCVRKGLEPEEEYVFAHDVSAVYEEEFHTFRAVSELKKKEGKQGVSLTSHCRKRV